MAVIHQSIPFPFVCGYVCAHPCEAACARAQYDDPVAIRLLKRAAAEYGGEPVSVAPKPSPTGRKVAIVGAGPCGLTAGYYLAGLGHEVTVFEALPAPGGMLRYGIPEYRLPREVLDQEIQAIVRRGVNLLIGTRVDSVEELLGRGFDAVLVAVGAWRSLKLGIRGEENPRVVDALEFLKQVNAGQFPAAGRRVVVVGGGNTAMDAARAAVRLGAQVTVLYRRSRLDMPAIPEEVEAAVEEGVRIEFRSLPVSINGQRLTCMRTTPGPKDADGRASPIPVEGSEFVLEFDTLIVAVGQVPDIVSLGLEANENGTARVDPLTFSTSRKGVFIAGDAATGPSSVIHAIAQGKKASAAIDRYLGGRGIVERTANIGIEETLDSAPRGTRRRAPRKMAPENRIRSFALAEAGYAKEEAVEEARRCLGCDARQFKVEVDFALCKGCGYCREVCSLGVFEVSQTFNSQGYRPMVAADPEKCIGCLRCFYTCPDFAVAIQELRGGIAG